MRDLTSAEIEHYHEHGVVYLPQLLDTDWLLRMAGAFAEVMAAPPHSLNHIDIVAGAQAMQAAGIELVTADVPEATGRFWVRTFNWRQFAAVERLGCAPPMAERMANLMGSERVNFYGEQVFLKEAGSQHRTAFHQDAPYFHLSGDQCCTVWMPLDEVDQDNGMMGYVRGSHKWDLYAANSFASQQPLPGSEHARLPDIEGRPQEFDIVYYPARPGDAIVHHVRTVHGATGNISKRGRRAFALRYLGDDVRYLMRAGAAPDSQTAPQLRDGDMMDSAEFPLIWTRQHGYRN